MTKKIKGFKAFKKDMTCRGFQYEEGKTYKTKKASLCEEGFHFCENPLDVLSYYDLCESEFHKVEAFGEITETTGECSKRSTTKIKIGLKLDLKGFVKASVDFLLKSCKSETSSGYYSQLASSGDSSQLASSGDYSKLASSGDSSKLASSGKHTVLMLAGHNSKAKGRVGNWITLSEWFYDEKENQYIPICVKTEQVDGEKIKEDTWYKLVKGKFEVCND